MKVSISHTPEFVYWDNTGKGYRIDCMCGWRTDARECLAEAGGDFDAHLEELSAR